MVRPCGLSFMGVLNNILAESVVDARLITLAIRDVSLKPVNKIGIEAQGKLLFDGAEEKPTPRTAPITLFWYAARVDLIVGHCGHRTSPR